ncbi:MAG: uroporphyrinogen-III C-methyltransferase [Chloroflexota bacterium]
MADGPPQPGLVSLVGAGPGDPGLITRKGLQRIQEADSVIYDRLADPALLAGAREDAELLDAGKAPGNVRMSQDEINAALIERSRSGMRVCRLKGGDPFVFGRGGEEAQALSQAGLPFEVVPGVTSAVGAPAYAGIPVTHRGIATSFTVVTGSEDPEKEDSDLNWDALAGMSGSLVFLMGWKSLPRISRELISRGMSPDRPAAVIQWGSTPRQKTATATLGKIAEKAEGEGLGAPAAVVIGEVAGLRSSLQWFDNRPLFGKRVLVTRTRTQASRLRAALEEKGAWCVEFPAIRVVPVDDPSPIDDALQRLAGFDWITFSSSNGVRGLRERMDALGMDARALAGVRIAAVGPATAEAVRQELGVNADMVPQEYVSEAVVAEFENLGALGSRVLVIGSDIGRDALTEGLRELGAAPYPVVGYQTKAPEDSGERARAAFDDPGVDVTTFTSSSGVDNLLGLLDDAPGDRSTLDLVNGTVVACMGPITANRARERGLRVDVVAPQRTMDALVQAIEGHFSGKDA